MLSNQTQTQTLNIQRCKSPCRYTPCYLVPNHFQADQKCFDQIYESVTRALENLKNTHINYIDYEYFPNVTQWKFKYLKGSDLREIHINCYWDSNIEDHIVEMNRVKGDGLFPSTSEFYEKLRQHVLGDSYVPPKVQQGRRPMMPGPPPLRLNGVVASDVTPEMFLKGINPIIAMAEDQFFEPRLEACKALCDMAKRDPRLLSLPECQEGVIRVLNSLIVDEFAEIREFAIYALSLFAEVDSYKLPLGLVRNLYVLVDMILNTTAPHPYEIANIRRRSCVALKELIPYHKDLIRDLFGQRGILSSGDLDAGCSGISQEFVDSLKIIFI